ncbi:RNA polymerase sigma factor [Demequina oxidasica]|uniref:RNA polymerase sigma factor n=1 Tax=Demequina oxidasica TaxID=676199 RepID=UPI001F3C085E|nr:sigma factor-like helix-turn-helix DNA-binding protein [Demequina oxidasica]
MRGKIRRQSLANRLQTISGKTEANAPAADSGLEVRDTIGRLPTALAVAVRLVHWEGFSRAEIATLEAVAASTVQSGYARAKALLKTALAVSDTPTARNGREPAARQSLEQAR